MRVQVLERTGFTKKKVFFCNSKIINNKDILFSDELTKELSIS